MKRKSTILTAILVLLQLCSSLWAIPTTAHEAEMVVAGWLQADPQPLDTALGRQVIGVETFTDDLGEAIYYIVNLEPSGFVIVSADDSIEPIIGFADDGTYDPSPENPLGALVTNDLNGRIAAVRSTFELLAITPETTVSNTQKKWDLFIGLAETSEGEFGLMARSSISDVRVAPLVQSKWGQLQACGRDIYNYYTPNNHYSGCVATAMAQLMRYHKYPIEPDDSVPNSLFGKRRFVIKVNGVEQFPHSLLKGGDGNGGPYKWYRMVLIPNCSTTSLQREAIGALCYDAGISINMDYTADGSSASTFDVKYALLNTFQYENAIIAWNYDDFTQTLRNIGSGLVGMINPNLDADHPVILSLRRDGADGGHSILADGYGYNFSTPYHHLNMGWSGNHNAWYNLPAIDSNPSYNVVKGCIYNIFTSGSGEIISGRVTDAFGNPIRGAKVTAMGPTNGHFIGSYSDDTNNKGIYALKGLLSNSGSFSTTYYDVNVNKTGYNFEPKRTSIGTSRDGNSTSGNRWGIDFKAAIPSGVSREGFETNNFREFPWEHEGDARWTTSSWKRHSGNYSAQAGVIGDYGITTLRVRRGCVSGNITFYRKVSSESLSDFLTFYIDGVEKGKWSGEQNWARMSFHVAAGTRTFEWIYSKDYSVAEGSDSAWIDDITFPVSN